MTEAIFITSVPSPLDPPLSRSGPSANEVREHPEQELRDADVDLCHSQRRRSRCCALNGAVARICQSRDQLIVCCLSFLDEHKEEVHLRFAATSDRPTYSIISNAVDSYDFEIVGELSEVQALPHSHRKIELRSK
ncbi:hypothetical protein I6F16_12740 [Bradyrhizobium sp. IC4060]|nr:hypothetical protein [Bradyrhizobium sp. IC4060]MCA1484578.1 hypothetical protein [Bradyrhizobium sp. IC4061]